MNDATIFSTRPNNSLTDNELIATPKGGGAPVSLATADFNGGLAVDGQTVYFTKNVEISGMGSFILPVLSALSDGKVTDLTVPLAPNFSAGWLLLDRTGVFVRNATSVLRVPRTGGDAMVLATNSTGLPDGYASDFDLNDGLAYWTEHQRLGQPGCVKRVAVTGGSATCIDTGYWRYGSVHVDATSVFFIRDTEIVRIAK